MHKDQATAKSFGRFRHNSRGRPPRKAPHRRTRIALAAPARPRWPRLHSKQGCLQGARLPGALRPPPPGRPSGPGRARLRPGARQSTCLRRKLAVSVLKGSTSHSTHLHRSTPLSCECQAPLARAHGKLRFYSNTLSPEQHQTMLHWPKPPQPTSIPGRVNLLSIMLEAATTTRRRRRACSFEAVTVWHWMPNSD